MSVVVERRLICDGCGKSQIQEVAHEKHEPGLPPGWLRLTMTDWEPGKPRGATPPAGHLVDVHGRECAHRALDSLLDRPRPEPPPSLPSGSVRHHD